MKQWVKDNWTSILTFTGMALAGIGGLVSNEASKRQMQTDISEEVSRQLQAIIDYSEEE